MKLPSIDYRRSQGWRLFLLLVTLGFSTPIRVVGAQVLGGHVPAAVAQLQPTGSLPGTTNLDLAIGLPLRNKEVLNNLLQQIYDPDSPTYRHYLSPDQFTEKFGPTAQDYQALIDFVTTNGLTVTGKHPNRILLDVQGAVAVIEKLFHLTMHVYQHPTEDRTFYAPDVEPSLDLDVPVLHISGLNNYAVPHPKRLQRAVSHATAGTGSGQDGAYTGYDFRAAYLPDVTNLTGAGQVVGLLEFDGYYANDITMYEQQTGLPDIPVTKVLLDGFNGIPTRGINSGNSEVALDIEMTISMAPGLASVIVYEAGPNGIANDILSRMASDNQAKQLSCSWSFGVDGPDATADQLFQQLAAQGQSFFNAAGDNGAFSGSTSEDFPGFPSDDPYITQVGGTTLTTTGPGGNWVSETVWNDGCFGRECGQCNASSGGISSSYSIPSWQEGISMSANQGSTTMRNVPDVAMVGENVAFVGDNGQQETDDGTSFATPLWAGFIALVNQQAVAGGRPTVGLVNPAIYAIGKGTNYLAVFHDITTGNNTTLCSPNEFYAVAGYDLCTGWGTPTGSNLINALAGPAMPPTQTATIIVRANPGKGGSVSGGGTYAIGTNVQIAATATNGWTFTGWSDSNTQNPRTIMVTAGGATYTADFTNAETTVATPTITPNGGAFTNSVKVTLSCDTAEATIHYTTNGIPPTRGSHAYKNKATSLTHSGTLEAIAIKGSIASAVASAVFTIIPPLPLTLTTTSLPDGVTGVSYPDGVKLQATGGVAPYHWSWVVLSGSKLPPGLTLDATSGAITGKPSKAGTYRFKVTVTDSKKKSAAQTLSLIVTEAM